MQARALLFIAALLTGAADPEADDGQWLMAAKDHANRRYSALDQITPENASKLTLAWTFSTGVEKGHEAAPLVVGDTMYVVTPFPNYLHALDLSKHGAPLKWTFRPEPAPAAQGVACCDVVNRGAAYADGKIIYNTLDASTVAVDAATGKLVWRTKLGDINKGETITMAPLVVKRRVLVGNSGGELGVRGWITALDVATGTVAWRAYSTGPDKEVLIGERFKPHYAQDRGKDLGVRTWPPEKWKIGGGTVWGWISYDPALDLIFHGTSNPGPWNAEQRPGDNKWTTGVFARDPDDGQAVWFYQWSPHDLYDYDGVNENVVVDLELEGKKRQVLLHAERNGYVYVLDRATGQVISATPFVHITTTRGVDLETGRLRYVEAKKPGVGRVARDLCPAAPGAKDWQPVAWSPRTKLLYIPANNLCMDVQHEEASYIAGTPYLGSEEEMYAGPGGHRGMLIGWDPVAKKAVFQLEEKFPVWSGVVVTATGVAFYGTMDGWFKAIDARDGKLLWKAKLASGVVGQPITYRGPDGKQYVAILSGVGGWSGAIVSGGLDARDPTAALGFVNAMRDLPAHTTKGGLVHAFTLP